MHWILARNVQWGVRIMFYFFSTLNVFLLSGKYGTHQALSSLKVYMLAHFPFPNLYLYLSKLLSNFARPPHRPRGYLYRLLVDLNFGTTRVQKFKSTNRWFCLVWKPCGIHCFPLLLPISFCLMWIFSLKQNQSG